MNDVVQKYHQFCQQRFVAAEVARDDLDDPRREPCTSQDQAMRLTLEWSGSISRNTDLDVHWNSTLKGYRNLVHQEGQQTQIIEPSSIGKSHAEPCTSLPPAECHSKPLQAGGDTTPIDQSNPLPNPISAGVQPFCDGLASSSSNPQAMRCFELLRRDTSKSESHCIVSQTELNWEKIRSGEEKPNTWSSNHGHRSAASGCRTRNVAANLREGRTD